MKGFLYLTISLLFLASCGGGGGGGGGSAPTPTTPLPTVNLSADPISVLLENTSTLTWSSTNATSCSSSWTNQTSSSGSEAVTISTAGNNSFSISCTGAGGSRSSTVTVEGYRNTDGVVVDGYISGAEVCIDEDESWTCDSAESSTTSDNDGKFTIKYSNGNLVSIGGTDLDSQTLLDNLLITHKLTGHSDFKAVTPVTSVAAFMADASLINAALGIDVSIDVFTFDPVANKGDVGINDYLYEKGNQLTVLAFAMQNITNNINVTTETTQDYFKAITEEIEKEYTETQTKVDIETEAFISKAFDNIIAAKSITIAEADKENTTKALASVLPVIEVKSSDDLTTAVIRFAVSTLQTDIQAIANGTATAETVTNYSSDILSYIAEDQNINPDEIAPDISAISDTASTSEDTTVDINVLLNDSYLTSAPISVTAGNGSNGSTTVSNNIVTYDPDADYNGSDSFSYTITQGDKTSSSDVAVTIEAVNDRPSIDIALTILAEENQTTVTTVSISDVDEDELTLTLGGTDADSFNLSSDNILSFKEAPDYETKNTYLITLTLTDGIETVSTDITILIKNTNDNAPEFTSSPSFALNENTTAIGTVSASDIDGDTITFEVFFNCATAATEDLQINQDGIISFVNAPDYEAKSLYQGCVQINDGTYFVQQEISININNVNDNTPAITSSTSFTVNENKTGIGTLTATDADGDVVTFSTTSSEISIDPSSGSLTFVSTPDYEAKSTYSAPIVVSDGIYSSSKNITVTIYDLDEYAPVLTTPRSYSIVENQYYIGTVTAEDPDGNKVYYRIDDSDYPDTFGINDQGRFSFKSYDSSNAVKDPPNFEGDYYTSYSPLVTFYDSTNQNNARIQVNIIDTYGKLIGNEIYGKQASHESGWASSLNSDGTLIATGSHKADSNCGNVRVFHQEGNTSTSTDADDWSQVGSDITCDDVGDQFGYRVALSGQSNPDQVRLAVSSPSSDNFGSFSGHVSIFEFSSGDWEKLGNSIYGENIDEAGIGLSISEDGNVVAIGFPNYKKSGSFNYVGKVQVYEYNGSEWVQKGEDLLGEGTSSLFGVTISLSSDGTRIAIGAPKNNDSGFRLNTGSVRVFDFVAPTAFKPNGSWDQVGPDVDGGERDQQFGRSVSLSGDGAMLAIGSPGDDNFRGKVEIYQYGLSGGSFKWYGPWGETLYGDADNSYFGWYSQLSKEGNILAAGGFGTNSEGIQKYYKKRPINNSDTYFDMKIIENIAGDSSEVDKIVTSNPAMSRDGNRYAIGYPNNSQKSNNMGKVSVYEIGGIYGENNNYSDTSKHYLYGSYLGEEIYLGCYGCLKGGSDSICNASGVYGSTSGSVSIWNTASDWGNTVNNSSPWNSSGDSPPEVYNQDKSTSYGKFSVNTSLSTRTKVKTLTDILDYFASSQNVSDTRTYACGDSTASNNAPVFTSIPTFYANENQTAIGTAIATDADGDTVAYSISGSEITINSSTGVLTFVTSPDYETKSSYTATVSASDGTNSTSQDLLVMIKNLSEDGSSPQITSSALFSADENQTAIGTVIATDADGDTVAYSISGSEITINSSSGVLTFATAPDYETKSSYSATVTASDGANSSDQNITVEINNLNDNLPSFSSAASFNADENQTAIGTVIATDADGDNVAYSISGSEITINSSSGVLTFATAPDYETKSSYSATVTASDGANSSDQNIIVVIDDLYENESAPQFTSSASFNADENQTAIGTVIATDADGDTVAYSISGSEITINSSSGVLTFATAPDYETKSSYSATVTASDGANSSDQNITVEINNLNDSEPVFTLNLYTFTADENQTAIGAVSASDPDGQAITYSIQSDGISVDISTGALTFITAPDYEVKTYYEARVIATDQSYSQAGADIRVSINNLNDNSPQFTSSASFTADENQTAIGTVTATDADGDALIFSDNFDEDQNIQIHPTTGVLTFTTAPNFEPNGTMYNGSVFVTDGTNTVQQNISVTVLDVNEAPTITSSSSFSADEEQIVIKVSNSDDIAIVSATDQDSDTVTYSISGSEINIDSSSGVLTFAAAPDFETKSSYTATVTASDEALSSTQDISVTIIDEDLWTISSSVIEDYQGSEYGCGGDLEMNKSGNVLVCSAIGGPGVTNIYTYFANNGSWSAWIGEEAPYPSSVSTQGNYGQVISLSDDGNTLAVSAPVGDGSVWAFGWNGSSWEQKNNSDNNGGSINNPGMRGPTGQSDYFGSSLSLDSDGNRIAVGTQFGNNNAGFIRVYEWTYLPSVDRSQWDQIGDDMVGLNYSGGAGLGASVALSNDGNTLIGGASDRDYANVYSYDGSSWTLEATFSGQSSDCFAASVDIDSDGDTAIVSANGCDNQNDRGYVNVYRKTNGSWAQLGSSILGEYGDDGSGFKADEFGHEVSMSDNGNVIAVSALKNPGALDTSGLYQSAGHVRVYQYINGDWKQLENDIDGTVKNARFGDVISLQGDGKKIVVLSDEDEKVYTYTRN